MLLLQVKFYCNTAYTFGFVSVFLSSQLVDRSNKDSMACKAENKTIWSFTSKLLNLCLCYRFILSMLRTNELFLLVITITKSKNYALSTVILFNKLDIVTGQDFGLLTEEMLQKEKNEKLNIQKDKLSRKHLFFSLPIVQENRDFYDKNLKNYCYQSLNFYCSFK